MGEGVWGGVERLFCRRRGRGGWEEGRQGVRECASTLKSLSAFYRSITGLPVRAATLRPVLRGEKKTFVPH